MTEQEYRAYPAISRSSLWEIRKSPQHFKYFLEHPEEPTPALIFGQFVHAVILQPELLANDFIVEPKCDRRTARGKYDYAEFLKQSVGKTTVMDDMIVQAWEMLNALKDSELASVLLDGEHEKPFFWIDEVTGEPCKCRTDVFKEIAGQQIIVDAKSCSDASTEVFVRDALKYGYDVQAQMYTEGVKAVTGKDSIFVFIAIEKTPPYAINIIQADKLFMKCGWSRLRDLMAVYHDCNITGNWYGYTGKNNIINNTILPAWATKEIE